MVKSTGDNFPDGGGDLLNCTALSWLYVRMHGLPAVERRVDEKTSHGEVTDQLFCTRPQGRIDEAVKQGLSILAGLALGGSVNDRPTDRL